MPWFYASVSQYIAEKKAWCLFSGKPRCSCNTVSDFHKAWGKFAGASGYGRSGHTCAAKNIWGHFLSFNLAAITEGSTCVCRRGFYYVIFFYSRERARAATWLSDRCRYSTVQYATVPYRTVRFGYGIWYSTVRCGTVRTTDVPYGGYRTDVANQPRPNPNVVVGKW